MIPRRDARAELCRCNRAIRSCPLPLKTRSITFATSTGVVATTTCMPTTSWCSIETAGRSTFGLRSAEGAADRSSPGSRDGQRQDQRASGARATRAAAASEPLDLGGLARSRKNLVRHARLLGRRYHARRAAARARPAAGDAERVGARGPTDSAALRRSRTTPNTGSAASSISRITTRSARRASSGCAHATTPSCARRACTSVSRRCSTGQFRQR